MHLKRTQQSSEKAVSDALWEALGAAFGGRT
jgi:hypothetical protein